MSQQPILDKQQNRLVRVDARLNYVVPNDLKTNNTFSTDIYNGLSCKTKSIPSKYLYDKKGSELFEQICTLDEYYPTRTELKILQSIKRDLASYLCDNYSLVELGSGSSTKTRELISILCSKNPKVSYYPIDISEIVTSSSLSLINEYQDLRINAILATYEDGLDFVVKQPIHKKLIVFLGSSFGNFTSDEGLQFLRNIKSKMEKSDLFLIGIDLLKDRTTLEKAYNDSQNVTARFNLNLLERINRELGGNFEPENFSHLAFFNEKKYRIEMHLRAKEPSTVTLSSLGLSVDIEKNESILTEYSYKYTVPSFVRLANSAGLKIISCWTDKNCQYALFLLSTVTLDLAMTT